MAMRPPEGAAALAPFWVGVECTGMAPSRRTVLRGLALTALVAAAGRAAYLGLRKKGLLGDADATAAAAQLGRIYLAAYPQDASSESLARALFDADLSSLAAFDAGSIREKAVAAARADFLAGRVVEVHEWCLSVSEARLCALVHLLERQQS